MHTEHTLLDAASQPFASAFVCISSSNVRAPLLAIHAAPLTPTLRSSVAPGLFSVANKRLLQRNTPSLGIGGLGSHGAGGGGSGLILLGNATRYGLVAPCFRVRCMQLQLRLLLG